MTPGQEDAGIFFPKEDIIKTGNQYKLVSKSGGKNLGTYDTKAAAKKRERQVQYFKQQEHAMSIPTFREYLQETNRQEALLLEADSLSTKFEQYICDAWNVLKANPKATTVPTVRNANHAAAALNIAEALRVKEPNMIRYKLQRAPGADETTDIYKGRDKTSKTDIYAVGSETKGTRGAFLFSAKEASGAQLISGHREDITSIFNIAMAARKNYSIDPKPIGAVIRKGLKTIKPPAGAENWIDVGHIRNAKKDGKPLQLPKPVKYSGGIQTQALGVGVFYKYNRQTGKGEPNPAYLDYFNHLKRAAPLVHQFIFEVHKQDDIIKGDLQDKMTELFQNNEAFRNEFAYEAASGAGKFGPGKLQVANRFLKFSLAGELKHTDVFPSSRSPAIKNLASQLQFRLRWKHGTKVALAADILGEEKDKTFHNHEPTYQDMFREHMETYDTMMLNEGWADNARAALQGFRSWMGQFIAKVLDKLSALASQGYQAVMRFLGLELESAALDRPVFV
jgi:hypothetical protein